MTLRIETKLEAGTTFDALPVGAVFRTVSAVSTDLYIKAAVGQASYPDGSKPNAMRLTSGPSIAYFNSRTTVFPTTLECKEV